MKMEKRRPETVEITSEAMLNVIRAERMIRNVAMSVREIIGEDDFCGSYPETAADLLDDVMCDFAGENLGPEQDYAEDSEVLKVLQSGIEDEEALDELIRMHEENDRPKMPKPRTMEQDEFDRTVLENGGYKSGIGYIPPGGIGYILPERKKKPMFMRRRLRAETDT